MAENEQYWKEGFLIQVRDGVTPADDPVRPGLPAHIVLVEPDSAKPLSFLEPKLAAQIEKEQLEIFGGRMLVIAIKLSNEGPEERWPISVEDAMKNVMVLLERQLPSPD